MHLAEFKQLVDSLHGLAGLQVLSLQHVGLGPAGAAMVSELLGAGGPVTAELRSLDLSKNPILGELDEDGELVALDAHLCVVPKRLHSGPPAP